MRHKHQRTKPNRRKKRSPRQQARHTRLAPRTADEFFAKSQQFQDQWNQVAHVITKMRSEAVSLRQASREFGINPRTVIRLGSSALRKRASGRYAPKASDRLLRVLTIPTSEGLREIAVRDSRQASVLGEYWAAVQRYLETGDASAIHKFDGKHITDANRVQVPLLTNLDQLDRLGNAGVLSFESLYAGVA